MLTGQEESPGTAGLSQAEALDELDLLATVEHALVVEYLEVCYALGEEVKPADTPVDRQVQAAARVAMDSAVRAMTRLRRINQALTAAGRPPQVGRAAAFHPGGGPGFAFGPLSVEQLEQVVDREEAIAAGVDTRFRSLRRTVEEPAPVFDGDLREAVAIALDAGTDHSELLDGLRTSLHGIAPADYLRATRHEPIDDVERGLLDLTDRHYQLVVAAVATSFTHDEELGGQVIQHAISLMGALNDLNRLLVARGLLPAFRLAGVRAG